MFADFRRRLAARRTARRLAALTLDTARLRAARGAAFLDALDPAWARRVDPRRLELADGAACVLGQLHGDYRLGLGRARVLDLSSAPVASLSPVDLGFQAVGDLGEPAEALDYAFLTRAWRDEVVARTPAPSASRNARPHALLASG
ncbi:MAG TPA: hypothetical protein VGB53_12710 [Rubricoccaceae bacterium]|jgi:hypothetical protein